MRITLDANIYLAAALSDSGLSEDILKLTAKSSTFTIVNSEEIILEVQEKLYDKFHWVKKDVDRFITRIRKIAEVVKVTEKISYITRDQDDNRILECALAGNADIIVSLDQDLIKLKTFKNIGIVHPKTLSWTFPEYFKKNKA